MILLLLVALCALAPAYAQMPYCSGGRDVAVHLFEWKWNDIRTQCSNLASWGYCAVQVSPPQEHAIITGQNMYPWWQRYQPVSYKLTSRSGSENEFRQMVQTCNSQGVYIYVDAIVNHMTGGGSGTGSAGSEWNGNTLNYPGVPYSSWDFHGSAECHSSDGNVNNYNDPNEVRFCRLVGLRDLKGASDYVRDRTVGYLNNLINIGVAGFRIDAAKHMWPGDIQALGNRLNNLNTNWFPANTRPFVFQEVIDQGGEAISSSEYLHLGRVTEFKYSVQLSRVFNKHGGERLAYLRNFGEGWDFIPGLSAVVFVDNHDNQRGHGGGGSILTYKQSRLYKMANAFMLAWNYGYPCVMSSYDFRDTEAGPPSDGNGNTNNVNCNSNDWICEHHWHQIRSMVRFHNVAVGQPVNDWWDNGFHAIAFGRGDKGFIVINNDNLDVAVNLQTGLPPGEYCDVISCTSNRPPCSSQGNDPCRRVTVESNRRAFFHVSDNAYDPMIAIHV